MNFMFEWQEQYLTSERSERVRYCSCTREHKIHIFKPTCNVLFIIWRLNIKHKTKGGSRDVIKRYDTHKGDIRKIRHSGPG